MAALAIFVGGLATVFELLSAFGVDVTQNQQTSLAAVSGLILLILGVWFHPDIPVGSQAD